MLNRWQSTIVDRRGDVMPGAVLMIRRESDQAIVTVYKDREGLESYPMGQVTADGNGYAYFYAPADLYRITSAAPTIDWRDVGIGGPSASTTTEGLIEIATAVEAKALTDALRAITPATLGAVLAEFRSGIPGSTFAEIAALTEDEGPVICTDMAGALYVWTTSAYFTGYRNPRCGLWYGGAWDTPEAWELPAHGGVWLESDPKHKRVIARYREKGRVKTVGDWLPKWNFIADLGGGEWKAPDLRDVFQRMDGTDADTANPRVVGSHQGMSIQNHAHGVGTALISQGTGVYVAYPDDNTARPRQVAATGTTETRPESTAVSPMIHI